MTITELSIKRPTLVVVFFTFLAVLGVYGFVQLKYELMPKMSAPVATVITIYPGGAPNEVETSVSKVIEDAVSGISKLVAVRTSSMESRSMVMLEFEQNTDIDLALQEVQRKVAAVENKLPSETQKPIISKIAFDEIPIIRMSVNSKQSTRDLYQFVKDKVKPRVSKISGVGDVILLGGEEREIKVYIDPLKLKSYGLSLLQITNVIKSSNMEFPTGKVKDDKSQYIVRVTGKINTIASLKNLIIGRSKQGGEIRLSDIAEIQDGSKEQASMNRFNGINAIGMQVLKTSDGNTVEVSEKVRKAIIEMEKDYQDNNLKFEITQDASIFTLDSANAVKTDIGIAIILVAFVMLIFLHSFRNAFIVMIAIPSSLVSTFFLMWVFDFSLNMMSLLAISLVIGILVDDSIVVLENIHRHLEMGDKKKKASLKGRNEIGFAALSITMVDVVVFVPLAFITGMVGNFLRPFALVVVFSTLMSLVVSFTITPMLASRITKLEELTRNTLMGRFGLYVENLFNKLARFYTLVLKWSLRNGWKVIIFSTVLFFSSFMLLKYGFIGFEFIPQTDRGEFSILLELDPGVSFEHTNQTANKVEKIVAKWPEVKSILTSVGTASEGLMGNFTNNNAEVYVALVNKNDRSKSTEEIGQEMKKEVLKIPGLKVRVQPVSLFGTSGRSPIQILVTGPTFAEVYEGARIVEENIAKVQGTTDIRFSSEEGKPELRVDIDRNKLSAFGLSIMEVGMNLRNALTGDEDSKFRDGINEYDIRIYLDQFNRTSPDDVKSLTFMNNRGQQIQLSQFANVFTSTGPTKLERENRTACINVYSQVLGKTSGAVANEITENMKSVKMPSGVTWEYAGEQKTMAESFISMIVALMAAILFVYMIMIALYNSYLYPFVVLFAIPVALIGALFALGITMKSMSIYSMLGVIMLIGLVGKNAILLVDRTNQMRVDKGLSVYDALIEAGETRLRPILMTTIAMVMGMLPIAITTSAGSEAKSGLGTVLIGGLLSSMFLTLVLVPVVYMKMDKQKERISNWISRVFKTNKSEEEDF